MATVHRVQANNEEGSAVSRLKCNTAGYKTLCLMSSISGLREQVVENRTRVSVLFAYFVA